MNKSAGCRDIYNGNQIKFQKYGVVIGIRAAKQEYLEEICQSLEKIFPYGFETALKAEIKYEFSIVSKKGGIFVLYLNSEELFENRSRENFFNMVESRIRVTIAEFAVGKVFLHAGVVGWNDKAIILPATSFAGKTTLVAELVKNGAAYYSDEYAVLDADGNVEPFPKWLSIRSTNCESTQSDCPVESLGGVAATKTIQVGMILFASYQREKPVPRKWRPKRLKQGTGIMEILPHTIPIRNNPKFVLEVLNKVTNRAIIVKTVRGDAVKFAQTLLTYLESQKYNII